jgi:hypothetical protein
MGRIPERQDWQTGRRVMLRRGLLQRRQSDGNSVAKRLSAIPLAQNAREPGGSTTAAPEARIGSALLLKTILLGPDEASTGRSRTQYNGLDCRTQRAPKHHSLGVRTSSTEASTQPRYSPRPCWRSCEGRLPLAPALESTKTSSFGESNLRSAPDEDRAAATPPSRSSSAAVSGMRQDCRNRGIGKA